MKQPFRAPAPAGMRPFLFGKGRARALHGCFCCWRSWGKPPASYSGGTGISRRWRGDGSRYAVGTGAPEEAGSPRRSRRRIGPGAFPERGIRNQKH